MYNNLILQLFCCIVFLLSIRCQDIPINGTVFVCPVEDEPESTQRPIPNIKPSDRQRKSIKVELGIFYEEYALSNFKNDTRRFLNHIKFLLRGAQAVLNYPSLLTIVNLVVNKIVKVPSSQVPPTNSSYDYRDSFCEWQYQTYNKPPKSKDYDLAMLLVHTNVYDKNKINDGVANMDGVCNNSNRSCVVVHIKYVSCIWIMAHEIMHTLGVRHDTGRCKGIMGTQGVDTPETFQWTTCSNDYLDAFLANTTLSQCLYTNSGTPRKKFWNPLFNVSNLNFHSYSVDVQCQLNYGLKYNRYAWWTSVECNTLHCGYDMLYDINVGRPLERTICGENPLKRCVRGNCVQV